MNYQISSRLSPRIDPVERRARINQLFALFEKRKTAAASQAARHINAAAAESQPLPDQPVDYSPAGHLKRVED